MRPSALIDHSLTKTIFEAVRPVMIAEENYRRTHGPGSEYPLDEYEFYLMRVGNRLATLLSHCEQLSHAIHFMSTFRQTEASTRSGVTRTKHLRYCIENYIVRTQTLYDLILKLVDAVFHLLNSDTQCRPVVWPLTSRIPCEISRIGWKIKGILLTFYSSPGN